MDKRTLELGVYFGYPECCIRWFSEERIKVRPSQHKPLTPQQKAVHGFRGFVPCPKCAETVTHDTIHVLIKNRICNRPYPHG